MKKLSWLPFLIVIVILLTMNCGLSQVYQGQVKCKITGTIKNEASRGLGGAVIRLRKDSNILGSTEISDPDGKYKFDTLEPGNYILKVERFRYEKQEKKAKVIMGQILTVDFILKSVKPK